MPRAKTKKNSEEKTRDREVDRLKADFWTERINAAKEVKKPYTTTSGEVLHYFKAQHDKLYQSLTDAGVMDFDGMLQVSVPKVAQMKNTIAPRLYVAKPDRSVTPISPDPVMIALGRALGAYLTYTAREAHFARTVRQTVDDGLIRGRMLLRQVWDEIRGIVTSIHLASTDFLFDPDFTEIGDGAWIAIRHREPLWQMKRRLPKWRLKGLDKILDDVADTEASVDEDEEDNDDAPKKDRATAEIVEWWEVLSKMGCGFRGATMKDYTRYKKQDEDGGDYVRLEVVPGHRTILKEGDWDVPFYMDRDWPISWGDLVETPGSSWPESPMGQVLALQKAVDLLTSLRLVSCKNRDRLVLLMDKKISGVAQDTLRCGSSADLIPIDMPSGYSLESLVKVLDFGQGSAESALERDFLLREMDTTLGTTSMVTGGQDSGAKDRSATATQVRNSAAETRSADMEAKRDELLTDAARKEALMVRLFVKEDEFAPFVKTTDINMFYISVELPGQAEIPVRPKKYPALGKDDEDAGEDDGEITLKDLFPGAATYFTEPQAAAQGILDLWTSILQNPDPRVVEIRDALIAAGVSGPYSIPNSIQLKLVDGRRVWRDTAGLTAEELMRELSYEVEAGKGVKFNKDAQRQNTDMLMQTLLPVLLQTGDIQGVNKLLAQRDDAWDVPPDKRIQLTPPPPPMQGDQQQGQEGEQDSPPPDKKEGKK
jgi:hypothetical protein